MKKKDEQESRQKLTNDIGKDHTHDMKSQGMALADFDPRIIELVRFLARTAAEKDYAEHLAKTHREAEAGGEKETLQ